MHAGRPGEGERGDTVKESEERLPQASPQAQTLQPSVQLVQISIWPRPFSNSLRKA